LDKTWKAAERRIAELLGGARVPLLGRKGCDLDHPVFFVEVKHRKSIAGYLWDGFLAQILAGAREAGETERIPAIALHRPGDDYANALICFRAGDYDRLVRRILAVHRER
jgi:hypothetical protein